LLTCKIIRHEGRQSYVLGHLTEGRTVEDFLDYLKTKDFLNHFIAWKDDGEIVSVRRLVDFERQYHLRVFIDGEVRGHYEYTPESHPIWHMKEVGQENSREDFLDFLGDWVIPVVGAAVLEG
jgi:predicted hydrolase (HD superfamily)